MTTRSPPIKWSTVIDTLLPRSQLSSALGVTEPRFRRHFYSPVAGKLWVWRGKYCCCFATETSVYLHHLFDQLWSYSDDFCRRRSFAAWAVVGVYAFQHDMTLRPRKRSLTLVRK
ncbi:hypothetical protein, unlikely [Trypanosoma brucei gambiense DAL972]|uniref:Uncharacterized protein n=1 Tax=Trypanosoma brucei gambiense (strain MHOM/CI/86/DAL972) TaxID=679716 RepID=D0A475_TRYB9|nr:hypothetical protein, unlikely [Trypanosoma brucei gambiense DAL972]CBH16069.1 hypothetical protein, unlikely [Trypanosoma brucei gambiense DAL972]|eukprot:XP_011778333.1 hypothetical protein, unlikely [Trypanosoma brucei gambiense DAL972]